MKTEKLLALLLSIYPLLWVYRSPFSIYWSDVFFFLLILSEIITDKKPINKKFYWPKQYKICWIFISVLYILASHFKPTSLMFWGGFGFFSFSIFFGFSVVYFRLNLFRQYSRYVVIFIAIVLFLQELTYYAMGSRFVALLPFLTPSDSSYTMSELISVQMYANRSSSFFQEPAHCAQYLLPLLGIELFAPDNKKKFMSVYAIFIVFTLIILRSGNGFIGMILLLGIRTIIYILKSSMLKKILFIIFTIPIIAFAVLYYVKTESGSIILERTYEMENDESAASYARIWRGYIVYSKLPVVNQLIGMSNDDLENFVFSTELGYMFDRDKGLYFNGIQTILLSRGIIGLFALLIFFVFFFRRGDLLVKSQILLLLLLLLVAQIFLSFTMLICMVISVTYYRNCRSMHGRPSMINSMSKNYSKSNSTIP